MTLETHDHVATLCLARNHRIPSETAARYRVLHSIYRHNRHPHLPPQVSAL
jgi:hypothetical protein